MVILLFDKEGFQSLARYLWCKTTDKVGKWIHFRFFKENITASTSIEEISRYLKAFRVSSEYIANYLFNGMQWIHCFIWYTVELDDIIDYFQLPVILLNNDKAYSTFAEIVVCLSTCINQYNLDQLTVRMHWSTEGSGWRREISEESSWSNHWSSSLLPLRSSRHLRQ